LTTLLRASKFEEYLELARAWKGGAKPSPSEPYLAYVAPKVDLNLNSDGPGMVPVAVKFVDGGYERHRNAWVPEDVPPGEEATWLREQGLAPWDDMEVRRL